VDIAGVLKPQENLSSIQSMPPLHFLVILGDNMLPCSSHTKSEHPPPSHPCLASFAPSSCTYTNVSAPQSSTTPDHSKMKKELER